jgi:hypothetical protein
LARARIAALPRTSFFVSVSLTVLGLLPLPTAARFLIPRFLIPRFLIPRFLIPRFLIPRLLIPRLLLRGLPGAFSVAGSLSLGCCLAISRFTAGIRLITRLLLASCTAFRGAAIPTRSTLPLSRAALA